MPDESNAYADAAGQMLKDKQHQVLVPNIWWLEIINVLLVGERRKRKTIQETEDSLVFLYDIPLTIYPPPQPMDVARSLHILLESPT